METRCVKADVGLDSVGLFPVAIRQTVQRLCAPWARVVPPRMWGQIINHSRTDGGDILSHFPRTDAGTSVARSQRSCFGVCHHHTCAMCVDCARSFAFSESGCPEHKLLFDLWCSFPAVPFAAVWQRPKSLSLYLVSWSPPPKTILFFQSRP